MFRHFRRALVTCMVFVCLFLLGVVLLTTRSRLQMYVPQALLAANASDSCVPRKNIVFLKTHKCASSTVMNIFLRYGTEHGLNFVLPRSRYTHYIGHPELFSRRLVVDVSPYNMTYNILTHHTRYDDEEVHALMPPDSLYVTIVRRPDSLFESLYSYCHLDRTFKRNLTMFAWNRNLTGYLSRHRVIGKRIGLNQMSFDLGFDGPFNSEQAVAKFVKKIASAFHLVMLADRLDESLILLKHLLCWNTSDMAALKINSRYSAFKEHLSNETKEQLLRLNSADWQLYQYFAKVFDDKVKAFGVDRMAVEVKELRNKQKEYYDRCVMTEGSTEKLSPYYKRKDVIAFKSKDKSKFCRTLTVTELEFHEEVKKIQEAKIKQYIASHKRPSSSSSSLFKRVAKEVTSGTSSSQSKASHAR
ncbi:galactosylceramide sulfotransferase-like [Rhipicephalus microplus]|uniref:galactosylceramide sulfotransferase-like n=1 Tax=Rhipicephalus microplus TaxID=6941 RepID=UPI003F6B439A